MPDTSGGTVAGAQQASARVRAFVDALARLEHDGDVDTIAALFAAHAEVSNPLDAARPQHGPDGARLFWRAYRDSFHNVRSEFRHVLEGDDVAILEWTSTGRTTAGISIYYQGTSVLEFTGDRVRRFRAYFDPGDLQEHADPHGSVGA